MLVDLLPPDLPPSPPPPTLGNAPLPSLDTRPSGPPVDIWISGDTFLASRYGVQEFSCEKDEQQPNIWRLCLGLEKGTPRMSEMDLYNSVVGGSWPQTICDVSPNFCGLSPVLGPPRAINVVWAGNCYLVSPRLGDVEWKILIDDPLTILQMEREEQDGRPDTLLFNLVQRGAPFEVLNSRTLYKRSLPRHRHRIAQPTDRAPGLERYPEYRQRLEKFFKQNPHAYAASLCAGGILWRIAMEILPFSESDVDCLTGPFHHDRCRSKQVDGVEYYFPTLTIIEEGAIIGLYQPHESQWGFSENT